MNWTSTDALRRRIVVIGLIAGPLLLIVSVAINLATTPESMQAQFDALAANSTPIVLEALLEALGFAIALASLAGSTQAARSRGGALGTWGAVLAILGIVGFAISNAGGFTLAALAQLPDHEAAFKTAGAFMSTDAMSTLGTVGMVLEILGQIGILLVIGALIRAHLVKFWLLILAVVGIIINVAIGMTVTTLIADVLLLVVTGWIAIALTRASREVWMGEPAPTPGPLRTGQPA
jgi:hypothetical protein